MACVPSVLGSVAQLLRLLYKWQQALHVVRVFSLILPLSSKLMTLMGMVIYSYSGMSFVRLYWVMYRTVAAHTRTHTLLLNNFCSSALILSIICITHLLFFLYSLYLSKDIFLSRYSEFLLNVLCAARHKLLALLVIGHESFQSLIFNQPGYCATGPYATAAPGRSEGEMECVCVCKACIKAGERRFVYE